MSGPVVLDKAELIKYAESVKDSVDVSQVFGKKELGVGSSQFKNLAAGCKRATCYKEIEIIIKHQEAKDRGGGSKSWANVYNGKSVAEVILEKMSIIKRDVERSGGTDSDVLYNLSLFFGYLHMNAIIWKNGNTTK